MDKVMEKKLAVSISGPVSLLPLKICWDLHSIEMPLLTASNFWGFDTGSSLESYYSLIS